jgi:aldehyde:ferredoxin oxidoreductase
LVFGWTGKGLKVNLGTRKAHAFTIEKSLLNRFLGGRGLASYYLHQNLKVGIDALSPKNMLFISAGPFAGTVWPASSRVTIAGKSPLTGGLGYAHAGGDFGPELKFTGHDLVWISGRAEKPSYLFIDDDAASLKDASHIWGQATDEAIKAVQEEVGKCRVACIGPAGENLVRISSIITDKQRSASRGGLGAVMGSKNLKALALRGRKDLGIADPGKFRDLCREAVEKWSPKNPKLKGLSNYGTPWLVNSKNETGDLPGKNHQTAKFPWSEEISGETIRQKYFVRPESCFGCAIHCRAFAEVSSNKYGLLSGPRPEYESIDALGPMCWVPDFATIMKANQVCNELGLDTISTGVAISFAMELFEKGIVTKKETGLSLEWGNEDSMLKLVRMIACREGFGDVLADGVARAAERIGKNADKFALHVKGMELPRQEPRTLKAFGLGHAVSNRGADHLYALPTIDSARKMDVAKRVFPDKPLDKVMDTHNPEYKPDIVVFTENYCAVTDALSVCKFTSAETYTFMPEEFAEALSALTGEIFNEKILLESGQRIVNLERCFNVREGFSRKDDKLPSRFLEEPYQDSVVELDRMLTKYYRLRGWSRDGIPKVETLKKLGLPRSVCRKS